ncbi:unnamed protein product [Calypogeia fissa]
MASRLLGLARRSGARRLLWVLEEADGVPIRPVHNSQSRSHHNYARSSLKGHHFGSSVSSSTDVIFHGRDTESEDIAPTRPSDLIHRGGYGIVRPSNLTHRAYFHGKARDCLQPRVFPESSMGTGLKYFTENAQFDPLGRRVFSSNTRVLFGPAQSAASKASPKPYQEDEDEAQKTKKQLDASADDCDQAVVGLSSASAKAKQKQKEELAKKNAGILKKVWTKLLGIGPALRAVAAMSREDWAKTISGWKKHAWEGLQHYWLGTKLLWADVRISSRLLLKLAGGNSLSRRERQQLTTTAADIFRLVPFAVFIIVPFMEFLLPIALRLFPNMLPSTFQDKMKEQEQLKKKLNARIQYAKFLQDTVGEMARELKTSRSGELQKKASELDEFMGKVRTGSNVTNEDILEFAKLFNDELTLDNLTRPRLVSMCKYMGIQPYGTDAYLRYSLRTKLHGIKADDRMIKSEGVESLSEAELRAACRERGMLGLLSVEEMRLQLKDWLDLSLNKSLPSSLLILSRAFMVSGRIRPEEAMQATLSSLPDQVVDSVSATAPGDDSLAERQRKLEYLKEQEELIKEEEAKAKAELERADAEKREQLPEESSLQRMTLSISSEARQLAQRRAIEKKEELCKISSALAVLASASSVSKERAEFLSLVNKEIQLYNNMVEKEGTPEEEMAREAYRHAREDSDHAAESASESRVSSALIAKVDSMLHNLEKELDDVDAKIGDRWRILDRDHDGKVTAEEVAAAATYLKDTLGQENLQHLISNLAKDRDGKILVEDIVKLGTAADVEEEHHPEEREQPAQPMKL